MTKPGKRHWTCQGFIGSTDFIRYSVGPWDPSKKKMSLKHKYSTKDTFSRRMIIRECSWPPRFFWKHGKTGKIVNLMKRGTGLEEEITPISLRKEHSEFGKFSKTFSCYTAVSPHTRRNLLEMGLDRKSKDLMLFIPPHHIIRFLSWFIQTTLENRDYFATTTNVFGRMSSRMLYGRKHCNVQQLLPIETFGVMNVLHLPNKNYRRVGKYHNRYVIFSICLFPARTNAFLEILTILYVPIFLRLNSVIGRLRMEQRNSWCRKVCLPQWGFTSNSGTTRSKRQQYHTMELPWLMKLTIGDRGIPT